MEQPKLSRSEIADILSCIRYDKESWNMELQEKGDGFLLRWWFMERDLTDPEKSELEEQRARKHYISPYMTRSEIIRTAFLAVQQAEMHEVAERFTYLGRRIFDPHMNFHVLAEHVDTIGTDNRIPKQ